MTVLVVMFRLGEAATPIMTVYADTLVMQETQAVQTIGEQDAEDDGAALMILSGGLLSIILFAVTAVMSTVLAAVTVAANMDVNGD